MNETPMLPAVGGETTSPSRTPRKQASAKARKTNGVESAKKDGEKPGLRTPQVRILKLLAKVGKPLTRKQIAEKAPVDLAACVEYLGSPDPEIRTKNDEAHFPSLVSLGYAKVDQEDRGGKDIIVYAVTSKGKYAAEKLSRS